MHKLEISTCPVCDEPAADYENCPGCGTRPRIRTLFPLMEHVIAPLAKAVPGLAAKPALAFATTVIEKQQLATSFSNQQSVSLYGDYGEGHEEGVDIRDLSRYPENAFSSVFGVLLFDYFSEHEAALRESYRVMAPGGVFITHITPKRLSKDAAPPQLITMLQPRSDFLSYVPADKGLPSVQVGRLWFLETMRKIGFIADDHQIYDASSRKKYDWFVGVKPYA